MARKFGIFNAQVDHNKGEFSRRQSIRGKLRVVSTQGIDGARGNLKTFLRARGGCSADHLESSVKEFQWRRNLEKDSDPFISLLLCIREWLFSVSTYIFALYICPTVCAIQVKVPYIHNSQRVLGHPNAEILRQQVSGRVQGLICCYCLGRTPGLCRGLAPTQRSL